MDPFEVAERAELVVAEIYAILASYFGGQPVLKQLFERLAKEEKDHAQRVLRWAKVWQRNCPSRPPRVDIEPVAEIAQRAAAFSKKLKMAEVIEADAAIGLAICIEQKLNKAHQALAQSEMAGLFLELGRLDDDHLGLLLEKLTQLDGLQHAPELPCDSV